MSAKQSPERKASAPASKSVSPQAQGDQRANISRRSSQTASRSARPELGHRSASLCSSSSRSDRNTARPKSSPPRRATEDTLAGHSDGLSCKNHLHACLSCAENVGRAYRASSGEAAPDSKKAPCTTANQSQRHASYHKTTFTETSGPPHTQKPQPRSGGDRVLDACALCGIGLSLPMVATDCVCVLAGGALGILFIPVGLVLEFMIAMGDPTGQRASLIKGLMRGSEFFGGLFGYVGYIIPSSRIGAYIGRRASKRLRRSHKISQKTADTISAVLSPGRTLLKDAQLPR